MRCFQSWTTNSLLTEALRFSTPQPKEQLKSCESDHIPFPLIKTLQWMPGAFKMKRNHLTLFYKAGAAALCDHISLRFALLPPPIYLLASRLQDVSLLQAQDLPLLLLFSLP